MIDKDGIERPDDPHAHMVENKQTPIEREIDENYKFINKNIFFRLTGRLFRRLGISLLGPWIKHRYKLQIVGKQNIKLVRRKGVVVTVNHVHNFDTPLIITRLLRHRKCYFVTLKDNVNLPFLGFILRAMGGIPIPSSMKAMPIFEDTINSLLEKKKAVIICPEASLWPYYRDVRPFKKGAFRFAVKNNVPVLPVVMSFRRKLRRFQKNNKNKKYKYYFTVHIGQPIYPDNNLTTSKIKDLTDRTFDYYRKTIDAFYAEEDMFEQVEQAEKDLPQEKQQNNKKTPD